MVPERFKSVCYDLDGVLVDGANWHRDAFNMALQDYGFEPIGEEEHLKDFNGLSTRKKLSMLIDKKRISSEFTDRIHKRKQENTIVLIEDLCKPIQRVTDVVAYTSYTYKIAVVTNCIRETAHLMLTKAGLIDYFEVIITNEDVDGNIKPHPWPYYLAKQKLGFTLRSKEVLAIDDTEKGVMSAIDSGSKVWHLENFEDLTVKETVKRLSEPVFNI